MKVVRYPILTLAEIVILYIATGLATTLWVGGLFLLYFGIARALISFVPPQDRHTASFKMTFCASTGIAIALGLCIFLFIHLGWVAAVGFIVLNIGISPSRISHNNQHTQKSPDLDASITAYQEAIQATPSHSPDLPRQLMRLSIALDKRFELSRDRTERNLSDLSASITALQQAVQLLSPDHPIRPTVLGNLEIQLHKRYIYNHKKELADLDAAIAALEQAIEALPAHAPERSGFLEILGRRQHERYKHTEGINDLDASIATNQQTLQAPPHELLDQPTLLSNLGRDLGERYEQTGERADLDAAFAAFEQASRITPPDSHQWLVHLDSLSNTLRESYKQTGNQADLDAATAAFGKAVQITTSALPDQHHLLSSLGKRQFKQYHQTGDLADLEMALTLFELTLKATPPSSPDWIAHLNDRGVGLRERYIYTRSMADLEAALADFQQVVDATPSDSPDLPLRLNNLLVGVIEHIKHENRPEDLDNLRTQIPKFEQAISPNSPVMLNSLGGAWLTLYEHTSDLGELNAAIRAFEQAIQFATDSSNRALCMADLGTALSRRYERTERKADLDAAIADFQQATQMFPADSLMQYTSLSNLARSLHQRFANGYNLTDLEAAISALEKCWFILHGRFAALPVIYQLGQQRQESVIAADLVVAYLEVAKVRSHPEIGRLVKTLHDVDSRDGSKSSLLTQLAELVSLSITNASTKKWEKQQQHSRPYPVPHRVLEIAEGSKSRLLTQLIGRGPLLPPPGLSSDKAAQERQLLSELTRLDTEELVRHDNLYALQEENAHLLLPRLQQRQRALHELEDLWSSIGPEGDEYVALRRGTTPTWEELTRLAEELGTTTVLLSFFVTVGQAGLVILRAGWQTPLVIDTPLNQADRDDLWHRFRSEVHRYDPDVHETWHHPLCPLLARAQYYLQGIERLILAPAGHGHLLPWAVLVERAGWRTPTGEHVPLVTLPALGILPHLLQREPVAPGPVLVVGNPRGNLPHAEVEAREVADRFKAEPLLGAAATKSEILARLPAATLIHLATHARFKADNPLEAEIELADGVLTAHEILQYRLQADLLVLSACESGQVGFLGGEELAGLSQAFLQAGVRSLLVSLWEVDSSATEALMRAFYTTWKERGADKAVALRQAMTQIQHDPRWSHPYYWGAFVFVGDWR